MGNLMKGIRIAAYIAEVIIASSVVIELVEKYGSRSKKSAASKKVDVGDTTTEKEQQHLMNYDKTQDAVITILEVAVSVLKGIKKLRGIFIKAKK